MVYVGRWGYRKYCKDFYFLSVYGSDFLYRGGKYYGGYILNVKKLCKIMEVFIVFREGRRLLRGLGFSFYWLNCMGVKLDVELSYRNKDIDFYRNRVIGVCFIDWDL